MEVFLKEQVDLQNTTVNPKVCFVYPARDAKRTVTIITNLGSIRVVNQTLALQVPPNSTH